MVAMALRIPGIVASVGQGLPYGLADFVNDNSTVYYSIPNNAALNLGSGAWAWFMFTRIGDNAGTQAQYLLSFGTAPHFNLYISEASHATTSLRDKFGLSIIDDAAVAAAGDSSTATGGDNLERLVVVQSTGTTVEMWLCRPGQTATRVVNLAINLGAITAGTSWSLGRRADGATDRYYEEELGGVGKANVALTQTQIETIAGGGNPITLLGANLAEYWRFKNGLAATETGAVAGIVATKTTATVSAITVMAAGQSHQGPPGTSLPTTDPLDFTITLGAGTKRKISVATGNDASGGGVPTSIAFDPAGANLAFTKRIERVGFDAKVSIWDVDIGDGVAAANYTIRIDKTAAGQMGWSYIVMSGAATGAPIDTDGEETSATISGATITLNTVPNGSAIHAIVANGAYSNSSTATYSWSAPTGAVNLQRGAVIGGSFFVTGAIYALVDGGGGNVTATWAHTAASGAHASIAVAYGPA